MLGIVAAEEAAPECVVWHACCGRQDIDSACDRVVHPA
jgi:hypothetical protein